MQRTRPAAGNCASALGATACSRYGDDHSERRSHAAQKRFDRVVRPVRRRARLVVHRSKGSVDVVARGWPSIDRGGRARGDDTAVSADAARVLADPRARNRADDRRPLHVCGGALVRLAARAVRLGTQQLRQGRPLHAGLRAGADRARIAAAADATDARCVVELSRRQRGAGDQRGLRIDRMVGRLAQQDRGGCVPRHAGLRMGHTIGHGVGALRRGGVHRDARASARQATRGAAGDEQARHARRRVKRDAGPKPPARRREIGNRARYNARGFTDGHTRCRNRY